MNVKTTLLALLVLLVGGQDVHGSGNIPGAWYSVWRSFGVDPYLAESVVWPERQQHDYLRDALETAADRSTYVLFADGFDFSIGVFQMKPSFVEKLEKAWMDSGLAERFDVHFDVSPTAAARSARLARMQSEEWQAVYIAVFLHQLSFSYDTEGLTQENLVKLAATAYNRGCEWTPRGSGDVEGLLALSGIESFPCIIIPRPGQRRYSYAALAWERYKSLLSL